MSNGDLEHNLKMNSSTDSSANSEPDVTGLLHPVVSDDDDAVVNSRLDQQVDEAFRDVEDLFESTASTPRSDITELKPMRPEFDSSIPNLVEPDLTAEVAETAELTQPPEPTYEPPPPDSIEEAEIRDSLRTVEKRMLEIADERQHAESRMVIRLEAEAAVQAVASARRREEEELRRQADESTAARRQEDDLRLKAQREQVNKSESELKGIWAEERRLRSEAVRLNQTVQELLLKRARAEDDAKLALLAEAQRARDEAEEIHLESLARLHSEEEALRRTVTRFGLRRTELEHERQKNDLETRQFDEEKARLSAAASARLAETSRLRAEAEDRLRLDQAQLEAQENELTVLTAGLAERRAELELARRNADEDAKRLSEARARMAAAAEATQLAEHERMLVEAQILERAETERQMLEDARSRAVEQQRQLEANERERQERESQRIAELDALRIAADSQAQLHTEKEQILNSEVASLQQAEQAMVIRIQELEAQRTSATESYVRMVDRLRDVEDEAYARAAQEGQARVDLERRIKEESENLKRLEVEHKQRIDEEISRRVEAEKRLQETKNRYQAEQAARIKAELQFDLWNEPDSGRTGEVEAVDETSTDSVARTLVSSDAPPLVLDSAVPVYQIGNLSSPDPRLRADAVTALARLGSDHAYDLIVNCFDDESSLVRNAAARSMLILEPNRPVEPFTRALKESSVDRASRIGKAISESGLANQAINTLSSEDPDETYNGLCLLFTMAKAGEVEPLVHAIETHVDAEVRLAAIRLLKLGGHEELASAAVERRLKTKKES